MTPPYTRRWRPKTPGLWIELTDTDGQVWEGTIPNDLLAIDIRTGFMVTLSPGPSLPSYAKFFKRTELERVVVLGMIGAPGSADRRRKEAARR